MHHPPPTDPRRAALRAGALALLLLAAGAAGVVAPATAADGDAAARKLAQAVYDRPAGRDMTTLSRMELVEKGRQPRVRELVTYRLDKGDGETANLLRFLAPDDIAGTGLLGVTKADGSTEQWLYLPALDRVRKIAGDRKGGRFVGSDLYFEDLRERKPGQDRHRIVGREKIDGVEHEILESVPVDPDNSVYVKRLSWVDPQTMLVSRVDYFERDPARPSKRWLLKARRKVQGYWTETDSVMTDLGSGHETRLLVERALYDRKLPARLFNARTLGDEQLESEHRP